MRLNTAKSQAASLRNQMPVSPSPESQRVVGESSALVAGAAVEGRRFQRLPAVWLEVFGQAAPSCADVTLPAPAADTSSSKGSQALLHGATGEDGGMCSPGAEPELISLAASTAGRIPYVVSALSEAWRPDLSTRRSACDEPGQKDADSGAVVQVFMPAGCPVPVLRALLGRLSMDAASEGLCRAAWRPVELAEALQLLQVASMLQIEEVMPELLDLLSNAVQADGDLAELHAACKRLELPAGVREVASAALRQMPLEPAGLPDADQVRGMIASALLTADGKVWRVVQKVIDRREAWPRLAKENAAVLLAFATGAHGSIRATPHIGFFWGSRDFLFLVCRYIRHRSEHFSAMVSAMFDSVYSMDPELPSEVIDAVFKELLVHKGLSFAQCEQVIAKLMQRVEQLEYLFHEWSGMFSSLPGNARLALAKGLLPSIGRCPHAALDFVLKELESVPQPSGLGAKRLPLIICSRALRRFGENARRLPLRDLACFLAVGSVVVLGAALRVIIFLDAPQCPENPGRCSREQLQ
ncbi:unnamed protein product [Polarella glacialis]|uniref:Uncharacterized protein n=1 Tax=Polarella glacialis TaxID=89957 RepID=A0A813JM01_POLGL|nr:unnamed protein product [Polarella glacialis]